MLPERIPPRIALPGRPGSTTFRSDEDARAFCAWAGRWGLETSFAIKLTFLQEAFGTPLSILSGFRTDEEQLALLKAGETNLGPDRSTHCVCPASAADLWPEIAVTDVVKAAFGAAARAAGVRWGGGSPVDSKGIPSDWNHVDEGPRH